jgi:hypothetical protein
MLKAIFPTIVGKRGLRLREEAFLSNIYEEYIQKGDFPYNCREKVPAASGKYNCIFPTIVGKRRLTFTTRKC